MTGYTAAEEYLQAASEADLLHVLPGLGQYVAGDFVAPEGPGLLVEYCDEQVLADGGERLLSEVVACFPGSRSVLLRVPASVQLPPPWRPDLTYLRHEGTRPAFVPACVRRAEPHEDGLVRGWLVRALRDGSVSRGAEPDAAALDAAAERVMAAHGRESWVWTADGSPVGHATVQTDAYDAVTDSPYVELEDILIESPYQKRAMGDLVAACVHRAGLLGLPLIGNVVHTVADPDTSIRVIAGLEAHGWRPDHRVWRRDLTAE